MKEFKEMLVDQFEALCWEFEGAFGRVPWPDEQMMLWAGAEQIISDHFIDEADYLRKKAMEES